LAISATLIIHLFEWENKRSYRISKITTWTQKAAARLRTLPKVRTLFISLKLMQNIEKSRIDDGSTPARRSGTSLDDEDARLACAQLGPRASPSVNARLTPVDN